MTLGIPAYAYSYFFSFFFPFPFYFLAALAKYSVVSTPELHMRCCSSIISCKSTYCDESSESSISRRIVFKDDKDGGKAAMIAMAIRLSWNRIPIFESMHAAQRSSWICGSNGFESDRAVWNSFWTRGTI